MTDRSGRLSLSESRIIIITRLISGYWISVDPRTSNNAGA